MVYNDFTVDDLTQKLALRLMDVANLFVGIVPRPAGPVLKAYLEESAPLAITMSTEKARSEMIIAPILIEARRQSEGAVSLFSGMEFPVDPSRGLNGFCDFLFSLSATQVAIEAPVVAVVEAKNENIRPGIPQCAAEMYAARVFNEKRGRPTPVTFGAVTTGSDWRFLRLRDDVIEIDRTEYYLRDLDRDLGVFVHMLASARPSPPPASPPTAASVSVAARDFTLAQRPETVKHPAPHARPIPPRLSSPAR